MELTNEKLKSLGFKRINYSMWRNGNITLQNGHTDRGGTLTDRVLNSTKAYKVCRDGKFITMVIDVFELAVVIATPKQKDNTNK